MFKKPVYGDAAKTTKIGNAVYNIQIFDHKTFDPNLAEGNYQNVQVGVSLACAPKCAGYVANGVFFISLIPAHPHRASRSRTRPGRCAMCVNINGRIEYELVPGQDYPVVKQANLLSLAVSSLEAHGIACTNVGITPITTPGANGAPSVTIRHARQLWHEGN